MVIILNNVY